MGVPIEVTELRQSHDARIVQRSIVMISTLLVFITVILLLSEFMHYRQLNEIDHYAVAINLAGRQRMLTQRIAYLSEVIVTSRSAAVQLNASYQLADAAEEMRAQRDELLTLVPLEPVLAELYNDIPVRLHKRVDDYTAEAFSLSKADLATVTGDNDAYQKISAASARLLSDLESVVTAYQNQLAGNLSALDEMDRGRVMFVIGGLAMIGVFIVWPGVRALRRHEQVLYDKIISLRQQSVLLEDRQVFNEAMLASQPSPLAVYDISTAKTVYMNDRYRQLLGYDEVDGSGFALYDLYSVIHPSDIERAKSCMLKAAQTGLSTVGEYRFRRKDGSYIIVESRASALYLRGKIIEPPQLVALIRPIEKDSVMDAYEEPK
jgi:PAS domain S-box-containing protein